jgi:arginyl-tRNA synthetase
VTPEDLAESIRAAVRRVVVSGGLDVEVPAAVTVERPKNRDHGDYATNVALQLAKAAGRPPRDVAMILKTEIEQQPIDRQALKQYDTSRLRKTHMG